jgi:hypothetical protein
MERNVLPFLLRDHLIAKRKIKIFFSLIHLSNHPTTWPITYSTCPNSKFLRGNKQRESLRVLSNLLEGQFFSSRTRKNCPAWHKTRKMVSESNNRD